MTTFENIVIMAMICGTVIATAYIVAVMDKVC